MTEADEPLTPFSYPTAPIADAAIVPMSAAPSRPASTIHTPSSDQSFQYGLHLSPADPSPTSAQAPAHHHHHLAFQLPSPAPSMRDSDGTASTRSSAAQSAGDRHPWQLEDVRSFAPPSAPDAGGRAHLAPTDVLHRMDLGAGIGAGVASLDPSFSFRPSGMSSGTHSASAGAPTSGGGGEAYEPAALDEVRFPASAFNSPSFAHASYGHPRSVAEPPLPAPLWKGPKADARFTLACLPSAGPTPTRSSSSTTLRPRS